MDVVNFIITESSKNEENPMQVTGMIFDRQEIMSISSQVVCKVYKP